MSGIVVELVMDLVDWPQTPVITISQWEKKSIIFLFFSQAPSFKFSYKKLQN